jgi:hypothetical protein
LNPAYGEGTLAYIMAKKGFKNNSHDQCHVLKRTMTIGYHIIWSQNTQ